MASAAHVQCGDTITQTTVLDSDVVCTDQDPVGLVIGGDDLTLWMAGYTIQGADVADTDGIADDGTARSGVVIRGGSGGTITGFDDGIDLDASTSEILKVAVGASSTGIVVRGNGNYIYRTTVDMSAGAGFAAIEALGDDAYLWGNTVTGSATSLDDGIVVYGSNPRIVNNSVSGCGFDGMIAGAYTTGMIAYNTVTGCDIGIAPSGTGIKVQRNDVSGNCIGVLVDDPGAFVRNNDAHNGCTGILILQAGVTVRDNRTNNNADYGIDAPAGTIDKGDNVATGNGIEQCLVVVCVPSLPPT
ncbi:MAG TPA: right-handed parallel beta-helix repeat-containing protein [Solirubrobacterales bacterium]|nr:right-handed parallel beta-helix repeat-containing protein [Solirubrobacterales bacterium]